MPITPLQLARRLRAARKDCHITQAKAARVLGIPRSAVSQMETGQRGVSALELHRLAQLYSRDVGGFLEDRFEESNPVAAMFRAHRELRECPAETQNLEMHDVVRMAHHFGVSCAAMLYRLKGLGFVTEEERSSLVDQDRAGLGRALGGLVGLPEPDDCDARCVLLVAVPGESVGSAALIADDDSSILLGAIN